MMDQGFPNQHTTTTTVTTTATTTQPTIRFDPSYIRTMHGMLKVAQVVLNLLGFICITVSGMSNNSRGGWFNTVSMGGFWFTGILLVFYLFHIIEKFSKIPWLKVEFIFCSVWTALYLLAAALAADYARYSEVFGVAAFFGFCAMVAYGYDAWLKFHLSRSGALAQGQYTPKQTSTVTSQGYLS
ncbi:CKLF-like MARVEL transmembrane domain-containing protein 4 [Nomia melanderi]|uniref:CKLF-like MARVEL transmembrane domain-containing protein 4 n=1 Tax=Nomia melanderi TaxID=2448451 RepID=UPI0013043373|nr:CKLF-like MARVEL transmembrane domain-containing protein 4 [Nomia melanderi]XP_031845175.1 CKLF-like MARVEL transmembrane domain-containing protein 4 [Nomia melanderi]XP_031845183.1 CKLF-like MARVEL transmembrane domain-containing protein 4 [Nomia melanderi]XP_031845190.1 CKLF-like MARVEL transmembrane domain-containing protein 4 [Nomia melanderi]XP_031845201.1 CKLF-like MARVEL transmembrane domain-containing protein 4 [Nomia melanderi]